MSSPTLDAAALEALIGRRINVAGHFVGAVILDGVEDLGDAVSLRIRTPDGALHETVLDPAELSAGAVEPASEGLRLVDGDELFDLVESKRIELAYAHDPNFAVSMSGVRGLPHQIVAVYKHMLPQPRLRFVLADDPGAGKTIMAGLLLKELRLRMVADRVLILCPAPLTVQWQDELHDKFDERFTLVDSHLVKWQLGESSWSEHDRCIASIDFAKRDEILPELLRAEWDLVIVDEAHKCSAASRWDAAEGRERLDCTKRYTLAEELSRRCERLLLMTATPHSGDQSRFHNFLRLLDPDQFAVDQLAAEQIAADNSPYFLRREKEMLKDEHGNKLFVPREVLTQPFELGPGELRSALGHAYVRVQVPTGLADDGSLRFASRELATILAAGRGLHDRVREALETHVAVKLFPSKIVALAELGSDREWRWVSEVADALPRFLDAPKVWGVDALALGIAEGVQQGVFGYTASASNAGADKLTVSFPDAVRVREPLAADGLGLGDDAALLAVGLAERLRTPGTSTSPAPASAEPEAGIASSSPTAPNPQPPAGEEVTGLRLSITATEDDLFVLNQSLSKLRDLLAGGTMRLNISVEARTAGGAALDRVRARNSVIEPLAEDPDVGADPTGSAPRRRDRVA